MSKIYGIGDEEELAEDLQKDLFELKRNPNIIEIPDNATNGEVFKMAFPYAKVTEHCMHNTVVVDDNDESIIIRHRWWDMPYKDLEGVKE